MTSLAVEFEGKWPGILAALGVESKYLSGKNTPCPMCGGKDRWRFSNYRGRGDWICTHCGAGDGVALVMKFKKVEFKEAAKEIKRVAGDCSVKPTRTPSDTANRKALNDLWKKSRKLVHGDPAWAYLDTRRVPPTPDMIASDALRYVEDLRYDDKPPTWHPGMVAKVTGPDGKNVTLHRTYLAEDGKGKAKIECPRRLMPGKLPRGCAIRLFAPGPTLGIAEGIETALAANKMFGVPVWAAISASMMEHWTPPKGVTCVRIFGDNDGNFAGQAAAYRLGNRLALELGPDYVSVEIPARRGDFNDVLQWELIG